MKLEKIILTNFKNYGREIFEFHPVINCFTGLNGMGKTNLLDAIYYLSMTKSYLSTNDNQIPTFNSDFFRLEGIYNRNQKIEKVVAKVQLQKSKVFEINQEPILKLSSHIGFLPIVFIAPDDISIILEGSELRRKFLDNTLSQTDPIYLTNLMLYNRILFQRNAYLKSLNNYIQVDSSLLEIYDNQLLSPANYIHKARCYFLENINPIFNNIYNQISNERESVGLSYQSKLENMDFSQLLKDSFKKDIMLQRTTEGIHKDDLIFTLESNLLKKYASQGQRKSFLLALKLAQFKILRKISGINPILLLDDIFDKLDPTRVQSLLNHLITDFRGQIFISDTHNKRIPTILNDLKISHLHGEINSGKWVK